MISIINAVKSTTSSIVCSFIMQQSKKCKRTRKHHAAFQFVERRQHCAESRFHAAGTWVFLLKFVTEPFATRKDGGFKRDWSRRLILILSAVGAESSLRSWAKTSSSVACSQEFMQSTASAFDWPKNNDDNTFFCCRHWISGVICLLVHDVGR